MRATFTALQPTNCEKDVKVAHIESGDPGAC